jgi:hypothetical protein
MSLLDDIHELQGKYADASHYERMSLDLAASLLEQIHQEAFGD